MALLRTATVRVHHADVAQVRKLLTSRRLDGITFQDNSAWWRLVCTFTLTGPAWAIERCTEDIARIHQEGLIRGW